MNYTTLFCLFVFCFSFFKVQAQFPPSVAEQFSQSLYSGISPKSDAKTSTAMIMSIKIQVKDKVEAMDDGRLKNSIIYAYQLSGYETRDYEQMTQMPATVLKSLATAVVMQASDEDALLWSGASNPFVDEQPVQENTEKFGNQHPNYDPKKPFWQAGDWKVNNFKEPNSVFTFDYTMRITIMMPQGTYPLSLYINSRDGSMGLDASEAAFLAGSARANGEVDFAVISKLGRAIVFSNDNGIKVARLQELRQRMLGQSEGNVDAEAAINMQIMRELSKWVQLDNIPSLDALYPNSYKCFEGQIEGEDHLTSLCFSNRELDIVTIVPNLGFGVGVFKDYVNETNVLVVRREITNKSSSIIFQLESFDEKEYRFDGNAYEASMLTEENVNHARHLKKEMEELQFEIRGLENEKTELVRSCKGDKTCLSRKQSQLARINLEIEDLEEDITSMEEELDNIASRRN